MTEPTTEEVLARFNEAENLKTILHTMRSLVERALAGERPDFHKAKRICEAALTVQHSVGTKVADLVEDVLPEAYYPNGPQIAGPVRLGMRGGQMAGALAGGVDEMTRQMVGLLDHQTGSKVSADQARARELAASELELLAKTLPQLEGEHRRRVLWRMEVITKQMEASDGLVHSDVLGGHQAEREGGEDTRATDGDHRPGEDGAEGSPAQADPSV